jgi:hypothetical protein
MSVRNIYPSAKRSRSALDRQAIDMAGHLLVLGIWLERKFGSVSNLRDTFFAESTTPERAAQVFRFSLLSPSLLLREGEGETGHRSGH